MKSFLNLLGSLAFVLYLPYFAQARAEYHPSQNSSVVVIGNATDQHKGIYEYTHFVPAETYQGGDHRYSINGHAQQPVRAPIYFDSTAEFINKTRAGMATGICYKEVPTASLVRDSKMIISGNGTTPEMSKIQVCCEGYERNPHIFRRCEPVCADDCPNGICTAPNVCVCMPGHVRNEEGKCITTCPIGCGNGVCDTLGECRCKSGYILEPQQGKYCVPHCEHGCKFGKCVGPNHCACADGYHLTATGGCEPKCDNCENGRCTAPGVCSCNTGYLKTSGACEPICALGCDKGRCIKPDVCECPKGFELDRTGTKCVPHCSQPCLNGYCSGDNICSCNAGYVLDEFNKHLCMPHCPKGCPNGFCSGPNFCICKAGFKKSGASGQQTCVPV